LGSRSLSVSVDSDISALVAAIEVTMVRINSKERIIWMEKILVALVAAMLVTGSLSGCGTLGKGKGKAPPPVAEPAPVAEPVYK